MPHVFVLVSKYGSLYHKCYTQIMHTNSRWTVRKLLTDNLLWYLRTTTTTGQVLKTLPCSKKVSRPFKWRKNYLPDYMNLKSNISWVKVRGVSQFLNWRVGLITIHLFEFSTQSDHKLELQFALYDSQAHQKPMNRKLGGCCCHGVDLLLNMRIYIPFINKFCINIRTLVLDMDIDFCRTMGNLEEVVRSFDEVLKPFLGELEKLQKVRNLVVRRRIAPNPVDKLDRRILYEDIEYTEDTIISLRSRVENKICADEDEGWGYIAEWGCERWFQRGDCFRGFIR